MQRPTSVTAFGILNIVFAAFGVFGALALVMLFTAVVHLPLRGGRMRGAVCVVPGDLPGFWIDHAAGAAQLH